MAVLGCKYLCGRYDLCVKENVGYLTYVCKEYLYEHDAIRYGLEPKQSPQGQAPLVDVESDPSGRLTNLRGD